MKRSTLDVSFKTLLVEFLVVTYLHDLWWRAFRGQSNRSIYKIVIRNTQGKWPAPRIRSFLVVTIRSISVLEVGVTRVSVVITFCILNISNVWFNFTELVGGDISTGVTKYFWSQLKSPSKNMLADLSQALSRTLLNFSKKS